MNSDSCVIDGFGPLPVIRPQSVAELGELVRGAGARGEAIYPVGGRTTLDLGNPPTRPGIAVDTRGLDQVIDFPARDMTITVQAGITIAKLQALLATENLRLPIDIPRAEEATLGGIIATNMSGPRRLGYGTLRDYVIGISAVNDEGNEFKAGGRVVKNVAGYDLCKLLVGSLGTLGVITQATLKLRPLAEAHALITIGCETERLESLLDKIHASRTRPVCVELLNQRAAQALFGVARMAGPAAPWVLLVGYEGNTDAVSWQVQQLVKELGNTHSLDARVDASAQPLWHALVGWQTRVPASFVFKVNTLPSAVAATCQAADAASQESMVQAHACSGIMYTLLRSPPPFRESEFSTLPDAGSVVVVKCPVEAKKTISVWGNAARPEWKLMRRVKQQFDPRGLFNPGRFVDGI